MKKHKMMVEFVALNETPYGAIDIRSSVLFMKGVSKLAKDHGFEAYAKAYPKEVVDYVPTGKTYEIKTVEDITKLTPEQFEMFVGDLRNFCTVMQAADELNAIGISTETKPGMTWVDSGKHEVNVKTHVNFTNKI